MAMSLGDGSGSGGGRRRRRSRKAPMSEINVTPLVDVMLVLLIVFMVAAPLLTVGVPIDLPETRANQLNSETEPLTVSIDPEGRIFLQESEIAIDDVVPRLEAIAANGYEERIFVRGDRNADYGTILQVMGQISSAGFTRLALISNQEQGQ